MDYIGGYSIIDCAGFGTITHGNTITLSDGDILKFTDMKKPTFIQNINVTNSSKETITFSGYGDKRISGGAYIIEVGDVTLTKTGDNQITVETV